VSFVGREQAVTGSFGADRADSADLYALIAAGRLDLSESISARYPLTEANIALQHLARDRGRVVRIVVEPGDENRTPATVPDA
jgi:propanol-preferring alcohol dehydrogenase